MLNKIKWFFLMCSGANREILIEPKCEIEQTKYAGIGATVFFTATLAFMSGSYALFSVFGSGILGVMFGILWGMIIFNLDRYIVSTMRKEYVPTDASPEYRRRARRSEIAHAAPRFLLAVFISIIITRPLELRFFQDEIIGQVQETTSVEIAGIKELVRREFARIDELKAANERLNQEIRTKEGETNDRYELAMQEAMGTRAKKTSGNPGKGPLYKERMADHQRSASELGTLRSANQARIEKNDLEIADLEDKRRRREDESTRIKGKSPGLLARLQGLSDLAGKHRQVQWASLLLWFLFILLETSPIFVKLMSKRGPYDEFSDSIEYEAFADQQRQIAEKEDRTFTELTLSRQKNAAWLESQLQLYATTMGSLQTIVSDDFNQARLEVARLVVDQWKRHEIERLNLHVDKSANHNGSAPLTARPNAEEQALPTNGAARANA